MLFLLLSMVMPQSTETELRFVEADAADVASIDALVRAYYESLSGEPGDRREFKKRYASLFAKFAQVVTPTLATPDGKNVPNARRIDDWMTVFIERQAIASREDLHRTDRLQSSGQLGRFGLVPPIRMMQSTGQTISQLITVLPLELKPVQRPTKTGVLHQRSQPLGRNVGPAFERRAKPSRPLVQSMRDLFSVWR